MSQVNSAHGNPKAELFRMEMDEHVCPFGLKTKDLLERKGFVVEDHSLTSRDETEAFKEKHGVKTTPQVFIGFYPVSTDGFKTADNFKS